MIVVACLLTVTIAVSACQATETDGDGSHPAFLPETDFAWKAVFTAKGPVPSIAAGGPEAVWTSDKLGKIYFFDGRRWSKKREVGAALNCVAALDASHVFAGGSATAGGRNTGVVYAFDGFRWKKIGEFPATADQRPASLEGITAIAAVDSGHVWAAGNAGYTYNGSFWRVFYHPQSDFPPTCISGSDADNVWAGTAGGGIYLRTNVVPLRIFFPKETFR